MKKVFIFGLGTISDLVFYYFSEQNDYEIVGFVDYDNLIVSDKKFELPVIKLSNLNQTFPPTEFEGFIAIGYRNLNTDRENVFKLLKDKKYKLCSFISKKSVIAENAQIGENCLILENQTIQPYVKIKDNVYVWSGNHIGHHSIISENTFVSSHVVISGNCKIGKNCFIGVNAAIADGIEIKNKCTISMGANVSKNLSTSSLVMSKNSEIILSSDRRAKLIINKFFK